MAFGIFTTPFNNLPARPTGSADTIETKINQRRRVTVPTGSADSIERSRASQRHQNQARLQQMLEAMERQLHPLQPAHGLR